MFMSLATKEIIMTTLEKIEARLEELTEDLAKAQAILLDARNTVQQLDNSKSILEDRLVIELNKQMKEK